MKNEVIRVFHKVGFKIRKHSPEILIAAGAIGAVASAMMACKATMKVNDILDESKQTIDAIHECSNNPDMDDKYSAEDAKKDLTIVYIQTGLKFVKLYGPAIALGALSLSSMIASNNILRKRNVALAAAYAAVDTSFKEYRNRVVERFGQEVENELRMNIKAKDFTETVTDAKGKEKEVTKKVNVIDPNGLSPYAKFFDESSPYWEKNPEHNLFFLRSQQNWANDKLKCNGILFLNDVYEMLGLPKTKAGQVVGWVYDEKNQVGDDYVDFGIYDGNRERVRDLVNGYERSILLDFNVAGNVYDLMDQKFSKF